MSRLYEDKAPTFSSIIEMIIARSPLQEKRLRKQLDPADGAYWSLAEDFAGKFMRYLEAGKVPLEYAVDSYLKLCRDIMIEYTKFLRTGRYSCASSSEAFENVYDNIEVMKSYMHGVVLSLFLWRNHFEMYRFFLDEALATGFRRYLEIGSGHGLFLAQAMRRWPDAEFNVVDISATSLEMTKQIVRYMADNPEKAQFHHADVREFASGEPFDFVVMGEVLEHVEDPLSLLKAIRVLLAPGGRFFITTCANSPAVDHVYLFNNVEEIQAMLHEAGFRILREALLPIEDISREQWNEKRAEISYAAIIAGAD